jgi:hypothetical protein
MRKLIEEFIVAAATQKNPTAIAEAGSAKGTQSAELHTSDGRGAETRAADSKNPKEARTADKRAAESRDDRAPSRPSGHSAQRCGCMFQVRHN